MAAEEQMMDDMGDDGGMSSGAPTPLTALEVCVASPYSGEGMIRD